MAARIPPRDALARMPRRPTRARMAPRLRFQEDNMKSPTWLACPWMKAKRRHWWKTPNRSRWVPKASSWTTRDVTSFQLHNPSVPQFPGDYLRICKMKIAHTHPLGGSEDSRRQGAAVSLFLQPLGMGTDCHPPHSPPPHPPHHGCPQGLPWLTASFLTQELP